MLHVVSDYEIGKRNTHTFRCPTSFFTMRSSQLVSRPRVIPPLCPNNFLVSFGYTTDVVSVSTLLIWYSHRNLQCQGITSSKMNPRVTLGLSR
ncbi:hypothetical protein BRADI_1g23301v3 [Brachypodium distachyon]|uniref:Uncharacterized protein n=1 Tax=Brachypodium distachyon TaxID=15368 RepID=A0A2K2DKR2_BRADI|nr:hypothetical protein BRADI_1g23301v3 [Brachypodium distachyon]